MPFHLRSLLNRILDSTLQSMNLPGAITALERPAGIPPALLKHAEEIFQSGGKTKVVGLLADVQRLAQKNAALLDEVRYHLARDPVDADP